MLLKTWVQYLENWIYISLEIQDIIILGWDGCPLPQTTPLMQTWDFLKILWNTDKPCIYIASCVPLTLFIKLKF